VLPISSDGLTGDVELGLRPEQLVPVAQGEARQDGRLHLQGKVRLVEELGSESFVHMTLGDGTAVIVRAGRDAAVVDGMLSVTADVHRALVFTKDGRRVRTGNS
jgi:ABC-type sugar transport system ATPase subunit